MKKMPNSTEATDGSIETIQTANLVIYILIILGGFIWNGTLLFMFARHKEIRTTANTMIFNLAVCDTVNIVIVAPLRYQYHYPHQSPDNIDFCRYVSVFHHWILCAGALSLLALSTQKFCITVPNLMFRLTFMSKNKPLTTAVYITSIWIISLLLSIPYAVNTDIYAYLCGNSKNRQADNIMTLANFMIFCVVLPSFVFFFNFATARRLKKSDSILEGQVTGGTREPARKRSANVVTALSILFVFTHVPYFIWNIYAYWLHSDRETASSLMFEYVAKHFLFLSSCFDPVALYMTSSKFRDLFRMYLFCCLHKRRPIVPSVIYSTNKQER